MKNNAVRTKTKKKNFRYYLPFYVMALPGIIYLICNNYMPMFGILLAFKKLDVTKGILGSPWAGLSNFEFLFKTKSTAMIIRNTILYNLVFIFLGTFFAVLLAILLNEVRVKKFAKLYQSLILIPFLMSWVIASYLAYAFLAQDLGIINNTLESMGLDTVNWYMEKKYWPYILTFCYMWKNIGYMMIIYYASIVSISQDYFEAAALDGATKGQQIRLITIPLIRNTVVTMVILNLGRIAVSDFGLFYQIPKNSGALYSVTETLDVYVYNALMKNSDFSMSSAASVFQSLIGFAFVMITNAIVRKYNRESAIF